LVYGLGNTLGLKLRCPNVEELNDVAGPSIGGGNMKAMKRERHKDNRRNPRVLASTRQFYFLWRWKMEFRMSSPAFGYGEEIPRKFTCDGEEVSPPLEWENPPAGTKSFALICDDPDAPMGTWVHWVLYDFPGDTRSLPEGFPNEREFENGAKSGKNSWGRYGYGGPCPPSGTHRYFFRLYALDAPLGLKPGANARQLRRAMEGHVLGTAELMGKYRRW
jgi:Raf kinase inhibitor-like YbhB/YbcL family protein